MVLSGSAGNVYATKTVDAASLIGLTQRLAEVTQAMLLPILDCLDSIAKHTGTRSVDGKACIASSPDTKQQPKCCDWKKSENCPEN